MKNYAWVSLYNCLYLISSNYKDIVQLESNVFEIFEDLDTRLSVGLNAQSLSAFVHEGWIDNEIEKTLSRFRDFVNEIDSQHWNANDFDHLEDWKIARGWANNLMIKLNLKNRGWDSSGETVMCIQNEIRKADNRRTKT